MGIGEREAIRTCRTVVTGARGWAISYWAQIMGLNFPNTGLRRMGYFLLWRCVLAGRRRQANMMGGARGSHGSSHSRLAGAAAPVSHHSALPVAALALRYHGSIQLATRARTKKIINLQQRCTDVRRTPPPPIQSFKYIFDIRNDHISRSQTKFVRNR
jgi:hypothetical protein